MPRQLAIPRAEVLTSEQMAQTDAARIMEGNPEATLPELVTIMQQEIQEPTKRNEVLKSLIALSRGRMERFLRATEFDPSAVLGSLNDRLDPTTGEAFEGLRKVS
jgi:hypothetical protein